MAGPSIGTWVKVRSKSGGTTPRVLAKKYGGGSYEQGQVITQSEYNAYKEKRAEGMNSSKSDNTSTMKSQQAKAFRATLDASSRYDKTALRIDEIENSIAKKYNNGKALTSESAILPYARQYVKSTRAAGANSMGEYAIISSGELKLKRDKLLKNTKDPELKKMVTEYWREVDSALKKPLRDASVAMKEARQSYRSLPKEYRDNLVLADLKRRGESGKILADNVPFIEGISPFSSEKEMKRFIGQNRQSKGLSSGR